MEVSRRFWLAVGAALASCLCSGAFGGLVVRLVAERRASEDAAEQALAEARRSGDGAAERAALRELAALASGEEAAAWWLALAGAEPDAGPRGEALQKALTGDPSLDPPATLFDGLPNEREVRTAWLDARVAAAGGAWRVPAWDTAEERGLALEAPTPEARAHLLAPLGGMGAKVAVFREFPRPGSGGSCYAPGSLERWHGGGATPLAWSMDDHATLLRLLGVSPRAWHWHASLAGDAGALDWLVRDLGEASPDEVVQLLRDEGVVTIDVRHENETTFHPEVAAAVPTRVIEACARRLEVGWVGAVLDSQMPATIAGKGLAEELRRRRSGG